MDATAADGTATKRRQKPHKRGLFKPHKASDHFLGKTNKVLFFSKKPLTKPDGFDKIDAYFKSVRNGK